MYPYTDWKFRVTPTLVSTTNLIMNKFQSRNKLFIIFLNSLCNFKFFLPPSWLVYIICLSQWSLFFLSSNLIYRLAFEFFKWWMFAENIHFTLNFIWFFNFFFLNKISQNSPWRKLSMTGLSTPYRFESVSLWGWGPGIRRTHCNQISCYCCSFFFN